MSVNSERAVGVGGGKKRRGTERKKQERGGKGSDEMGLDGKRKEGEERSHCPETFFLLTPFTISLQLRNWF